MKASPWTKGQIYTRPVDDLERGRYGYIEIRDDVADGWEWTLYEGSTSNTVGLADTLAKAKRAAMREAKRLGWPT